MFCPKCGSNNEDGARFCFSCGQRMSDGASQAPRSGPAWRDFNAPQAPAPPPVPTPIAPPPTPIPAYQPPVAPRPQVVIGAPTRPSSFGGIFVFFSVVALLGAVGFAAYRFVEIDTSTWPLIGEGKRTADGAPEGVLVTINGPCKDTANQPCNVLLDIMDFKVTPANTQITYEVRATGQKGCQIPMRADKDVVAENEAAGKPGPYLEGARGRYYPLQSSLGFLGTGGTLTCDKTEKGSWAFLPGAGETSFKLRYPGIPLARIDVNPLAGKVIPPDDPISVIPVQSTGCTTAQRQPCRAGWEIGPYGVGVDGSPTVFFGVRFDGPANCTIPWQPLIGVHQAEIAAQRKGIYLQRVGQPGDLTLTGTGGMASSSAAHPCAQVLYGFFRFAPGNLTQTVNLMFWEFPPVQIPLKAQP